MYSDQSTIETEIFCGKYRRIKGFKSGGMGKVFLVEDCRKRKQYVMKIVPADKQGMREVKYLKKSEGLPGIPKIIEWKRNDHEIFMIMEYVRGNSLKDLVKRKKKIRRSKIIRWSLSLCEILQGLHQMKPSIICLDLKPEHIRLTPAGKVYLIDFGISAYKGEELEGYGTRGFAAPEQMKKGSRADVRMDIFSFGRILDFCLGKMRWKGLEAVIKKCTENQPEDRYPSMDVLQQSLKRERRRNVRKKAVIFAAALSLAACIGNFSFPGSASARTPKSTKKEIQRYLFGDEKMRPDYIMARQCLEEWQGKDSETRRYERLLDALEDPKKIKSWEVIWQDLRKNSTPGLYETCFLSQIYLSRQKQLSPFGKPVWQAWRLLERCREWKVSGTYWEKRVEEERLQAAGNLAMQGEEFYLQKIAKERLRQVQPQEEVWSEYRGVIIFLERKGKDADSYYEDFLQKFPGCEEAYVEYGIYLCRLGRWEEAQAIYKRGEKQTGMTSKKAGELKEKLGI